MALTKKLVVYDNNLGAILRFLEPRSSGGSPDTRFQDFDQVVIKYEVQLSDQAYDLLQNNPLLKQKIQLDMFQVVPRIVRTRIVRQMGQNQKPNGLFVRRVSAALDEGKRDVVAVVDGVLKRHAEMDAAWGKYYKGMRKDMIINVVGVALSAASLALAVPTGGASIALSVIGGTKSIAGTINKFKEAWRTAQQQHDRILKSIQTLMNAYLKSVHGGRAIQVGGSIIEVTGLLSVMEAAPFVHRKLMPSFKSISSDMDTYKGKLGHLYSVANKLAVQLFELLDQIDEWKRQNPGATMPKLAKLEKQIDSLLESGKRVAGFRSKLTISGAYSVYEKGMLDYDILQTQQRRLIGLESNPRAVTIISEVIKVLGNLALAGAGYAGGVENTAKEIAGTTIGAFNDLASTGLEFKEFYDDAKKDVPPQQQQQLTQVEAKFEQLATPTPPPRPPRPRGRRIARPPVRSGPPPGPPPVPPRRQTGA